MYCGDVNRLFQLELMVVGITCAVIEHQIFRIVKFDHPQQVAIGIRILEPVLGSSFGFNLDSDFLTT